MERLYLICIDDQREVLSAVVRDLDKLASWINVEECESAAEAICLIDDLDAKGKRIALVISDHIMPGKNGVNFLAELAVDPRFYLMKKVLLTGQASHKDTIEAVNRAQIQYYLEKPWQPDMLVAICRKLLTEFVFDSGIDITPYLEFADQAVVLERVRDK
ncbi:MAG: response regulator [Plesiomonas sp.]|uniref:response regulator n=1 Tax=Plesiomonas sp. TaxID=2486279 RepID=UPI003F3790DF